MLRIEPTWLRCSPSFQTRGAEPRQRRAAPAPHAPAQRWAPGPSAPARGRRLPPTCRAYNRPTTPLLAEFGLPPPMLIGWEQAGLVGLAFGLLYVCADVLARARGQLGQRAHALPLYGRQPNALLQLEDEASMRAARGHLERTLRHRARGFPPLGEAGTSDARGHLERTLRRRARGFPPLEDC